MSYSQPLVEHSFMLVRSDIDLGMNAPTGRNVIMYITW